MESNSLLNRHNVREYIASWFRPNNKFIPNKLRQTLLGSQIGLTLAEVMVYTLIARSAKHGDVPGYTPDLVLVAIAGLECVLSPFISWLGYWCRRKMMMLWHVVLVLFVFSLFLLPNIDVDQEEGAELCGGNPGFIQSGMTGKSIIRLCMLIAVGVASSVSRVGIIAHGLGYLEEYSSDKTSKNFAIIMLARVLAILQSREMMRSSTSMVLIIFMIASPMILHIFKLLKYHQHAPGTEEKRKESIEDRGFLQSLMRVVTNKVAVTQMLSMAILTSAVWGFFLYDVEMVKTKFLIVLKYSTMVSFIDPPRILVVIALVMLFGYKYSPPLMPSLNRFMALKNTAICCFLSIVLYMLITFVIKCNTGDVAGLNNHHYSQPVCSFRCSCGPPYSDFSPVCSVDEMVTYYSPCHAGCSTTHQVNGFQVFGNCSCASEVGVGRSAGVVTPGACSDGSCYIAFFVYHLLVVVLIALYLMAIQWQGAVMIQAVDWGDKSVVIGVAGSIVSLIAFVIGHMVYTFVYKDETCAWSEYGHCRLYKNSLPIVLGSSSAILTAVSFIISVASSIYFYRKNQVNREN